MQKHKNRDQVLNEIDKLDKLVVALVQASIQILNVYDFTMLDKGIGSNTRSGKKWLNFRKAVEDIKEFINIRP